jgi:hypothetical protein
LDCIASSVVLLCYTKSNSEARAKVLFGEKNFLTACFKNSYVPKIFRRPKCILGGKSTAMVAKERELLGQVFMHVRVSREVTDLVGGDLFGW